LSEEDELCTNCKNGFGNNVEDALFSFFPSAISSHSLTFTKFAFGAGVTPIVALGGILSP
jgi:hypothetical protein